MNADCGLNGVEPKNAHRQDPYDTESWHDQLAFAEPPSVARPIASSRDRFAMRSRELFRESRTLALNLVASPGAGKTCLLVRTLHELKRRCPVAVIEGDQHSSLDAQRVRETGVPALQINTRKQSHLDAEMVLDAVEILGAPREGVLFIENVGNLVCPAEVDLGETAKVVLVSLTEGEDKPLKYPDTFHAARLVVVTKMDLLPHLDVDLVALVANVQRINPTAEVICVSAKSGEGMDGWMSWIDQRRRPLAQSHG